MIHSITELQEWIDAAPARHARISDSACACGWRSDVDWVAWSDHVEGGPIHDLEDELPSRTQVQGESDPVTLGQLQDDLYEIIDRLHDELDRVYDLLVAVALGACDPVAESVKVLHAMPQSIWAEQIQDRFPLGE